jgi:branched-chain amino acid transport system ATP-binding protein
MRARSCAGRARAARRSCRRPPYGEQRLVGVALALAAEPTMLLLDEPVSGMNEAESARVMRLVETIRASGVTVLLVEHDMPMVMQVSDRTLSSTMGRSSQDLWRPFRMILTSFGPI